MCILHSTNTLIDRNKTIINSGTQHVTHKRPSFALTWSRARVSTATNLVRGRGECRPITTLGSIKDHMTPHSNHNTSLQKCIAVSTNTKVLSYGSNRVISPRHYNLTDNDFLTRRDTCSYIFRLSTTAARCIQWQRSKSRHTWHSRYVVTRPPSGCRPANLSYWPL